MQGTIVFFSFFVLYYSAELVTTSASRDHHLPSSSSSSSTSSKHKYNKIAQEEVYIVYTKSQPPLPNVPAAGSNGRNNAEPYYLSILSPVLGSEKAAKKALVYVYSTFSGFSAKLTPHQASLLQKQAEVLFIQRSQNYQVHARDGRN